MADAGQTHRRGRETARTFAFGGTGNTRDFIRVRNNEVGVSNGGSLTVNSNDSDVRLIINTVANKLTCSDNTPPPSGAGNTAGSGGSGQCEDLA